jgi:hypothetical protein
LCTAGFGGRWYCRKKLSMKKRVSAGMFARTLSDQSGI